MKGCEVQHEGDPKDNYVFNNSYFLTLPRNTLLPRLLLLVLYSKSITFTVRVPRLLLLCCGGRRCARWFISVTRTFRGTFTGHDQTPIVWLIESISSTFFLLIDFLFNCTQIIIMMELRNYVWVLICWLLADDRPTQGQRRLSDGALCLAHNLWSVKRLQGTLRLTITLIWILLQIGVFLP